MSAVWPCFHHRYSSFTSQTRVPHLHALICVQITPQITNIQTKTSVLYTPVVVQDGWLGRVETWLDDLVIRFAVGSEMT